MASKQFVVAVDGSKNSELALYNAIKFASPKDTLHLVHVCPDDDSAQAMYMGDNWMLEFNGSEGWRKELKTRNQTHAKKILENSSKMVKESKIPCKLIQLTGDARDQLCHYCSKEKADVLVLGSRGLGGIQRMVLGSVSDHCIRNAKCPVLVVKENVELKS